MALKTLNCPNCNAPYNPTEYRCEYCGSYVITATENYVDLSKIAFETTAVSNDKYPGIYVFGRLLGKGEKPISLGAANYFTGLASAGGKLLLTNKSLSFSAHALNVGKKETIIDLKQVTDVKVVANLLISQHILVIANGKSHKFVVYHGKEWVQKINEAIAKYEEVDTPVPQQKSSNCIEELRQLKQLLDMGIITEDEFNIKKKMILGL